MEHEVERRRERRYAVPAKVIVRRGDGGGMTAAARNISDTGMSLDVAEPAALSVGEEVTVEVELEDDPERAFSTWGVAKIVRKDSCNLGIQFYAGTFELERVPPMV